MATQTSDRATQIREAVALARRKVPSLSTDYEETTIASGKPVDQVKSELFHLLVGRSDRDKSKANMQDLVAQGAAASGDLPGQPPRRPLSSSGRGASTRKTLASMGPKPAA